MKLIKPVAPLLTFIPSIAYIPVLIEVFKGFHLGGLNIIFIFITSALRPSLNHFPVVKYYNEQYFDSLKKIAINMGFKAVTSLPFARSSYKSKDEYRIIKSKSF